MGLPPAARRTHAHRILGGSALLAALIVVSLLGPSAAQPAFPGSNGKIAFRNTADGNGNIFAAAATPGAAQERLTTDPADDGQPAWSPDGRRIAFRSNRDGGYEIFLMNAEGTGQTRLTNLPASRFATQPNWAPDGRRVIFRSDRDATPELFVINVDGSTLRRVTSNSTDERYPGFSPDGSRILFASNRDGDYEIYTMSTGGQDLAQLTRNGSVDTAPAWAPNGDRIVFRSERDGNSEIYVMNPDGSGQTRVTSSAAAEEEPDWSPDQLRLVFSSDRDGKGNSEIYTLAPDGTGLTRLTITASREFFPDWQALGAPVSVPRPPATDTRAPSLRLRLSRRRSVLRSRALIVTARCDERCTVTATARLRGPGGATLAGAKTRRTIPGAVTRSLRLRLSKGELRRIGRALRRGRTVKARVSARARDRSGNSRRVKRTFSLAG